MKGQKAISIYNFNNAGQHILQLEFSLSLSLGGGEYLLLHRKIFIFHKELSYVFVIFFEGCREISLVHTR